MLTTLNKIKTLDWKCLSSPSYLSFSLKCGLNGFPPVHFLSTVGHDNQKRSFLALRDKITQCRKPDSWPANEKLPQPRIPLPHQTFVQKLPLQLLPFVYKSKPLFFIPGLAYGLPQLECSKLHFFCYS